MPQTVGQGEAPLKKTLLATLLAGALAASASLAAETPKECPVPAAAKPPAKKLQAGSPAPALKVLKWVKGTPITKFEKGKIYVVEFWATWCPPCRKSIPHLSELAKKYKGKITFIGVDVWDSTDRATNKPYTKQAYIDHVAGFVKEQGNQMAYNVALDDLAGTMGRTWMQAAEQNGIPAAFVVGADGKIVTITHPMDLDPILEQVAAGKFNNEDHAKKQADEKAALSEVQRLCSESKFKEAVEAADKLIAQNPGSEKTVGYIKFSAMLNVDAAAAMEYGHKIADGIYKDDGMGQQVIAMSIAGINGLKTDDYQFGLKMAESAGAKTPELAPLIRDTCASLYAKLGQWDKAVSNEQEAIDFVSKMPGTEKWVAEANKRLSEYRSHLPAK